jgi:hypothetical protein
MERFRIGSCWRAQNPATLEDIELGIVYKYENAARQAYHMFRTWNYGRFVDDDGNIDVCVVIEGDGRYSLIVRPGRRLRSLLAAEDAVASGVGGKAEVEVCSAHYFMCFSLDYRNDPEKQQMMEGLQRIQYLRLNTYFIEDDHLKAFSKRRFRLKRFRVHLRNEIGTGTLESQIGWKDPQESVPKDVLRLVDRVRANLPEDTA